MNDVSMTGVPLPKTPLRLSVLPNHRLSKDESCGFHEVIATGADAQAKVNTQWKVDARFAMTEYGQFWLSENNLEVGDTVRGAYASASGVSTSAKGGDKAVWGKGHDLLRMLRPIGKLFLRLIKMVIAPLVFCSLLVGILSVSYTHLTLPTICSV